jgi:anti-anti-sigma factor
MEIERSDDGATIELAVIGELTIFAAAEAYGMLTRVLSEKRDLRIHLGRVTEIDSSGVQILLAAKRAAEKQGHAFSLVAHSEAVLEVMDLMQLSPVFGDPVVVPAQAA